MTKAKKNIADGFDELNEEPTAEELKDFEKMEVDFSEELEDFSFSEESEDEKSLLENGEEDDDVTSISRIESEKKEDERLSPPVLDPVREYLRDIGDHQLLTFEEETSLSDSVQQGINAKVALMAEEEPSDMEKKRLLSLIQSGKDAQNRLCESNLKFVVSIAKRYSGRGVPLEDLIQEGNLGLIKATEKFDPSKGYRFSTYAGWWIRQGIMRSIADTGKTIRLPVHVVEVINKYTRTERMMTQILGYTPGPMEIANELNMPIDKAYEIAKLTIEPLPLETPVGDDGDAFLIDFVETKDEDTMPEEVIANIALQDQLEELMQDLTDREQDIVRMRFGFGNNDGPRTLEEVGAHFNVTRERVRQIEATAIRRLRHPKRKNILKDFMEG